MSGERRKDSFVRLSANLTNTLVNGDTSATVIQQVQTELQAYFPINPLYFGGVLYHPNGNGPEKPYFKPEGDDWLPEVQAIAEIGFQYLFWQRLYHSLIEGKVDPMRIGIFKVLVLHANPDGSSDVYIDSRNVRLKEFASDVGDETPRFSSYVKLSTCMGGADFYGANSNQIFPMKVETEDGERRLIERETLGIPIKMAQQVWDSWYKFLRWESFGYARAFYHVFMRNTDGIRALPDEIAEPMEKACYDQDFLPYYPSNLERFLLTNRVYEDDKRDLTHETVWAMGRKLRSWRAVLNPASEHVTNLSLMYETAKAHCRDIYHYQ